MTRLVLIEGKRYSVYEGNRCIAAFEQDEQDKTPLTAKEVEDLRVDNYKEKA